MELTWEKVYQGPFLEGEAESIVRDLQRNAQPETNMIYDAKKKECSKKNLFHIYILTEK